MRISDWSSDVCSSDLAISKGNGASGAFAILTELKRRLAEIAQAKALTSQLSAGVFCDQLDVDGAGLARQAELGSHRSEERRVGKECVRCRFRWSPQYQKQKRTYLQHSISTTRQRTTRTL